MKQILKWTGLVLLAAAVGLAFAMVFTAGIRRQAPYSSNYGGPFSSQNDYRIWSMMGPEMMGRGYRADTWQYSGGEALTLDQAIEAANLYVTAYGTPDLTITEVMEFTENFYAEVEEKSSGIHAFEILIDRYTGSVHPEPGPNMMWNSKYGHMRGMMGGWGGWQQAGPISVTSDQALDFAQEWLDQYLPGTSVAEKADTFYGYYTIHILKDGQVYGMLSVNGYTGEVWDHTWHGSYIGMKELEE